jgi:penicillin-binding protein 2
MRKNGDSERIPFIGYLVIAGFLILLIRLLQLQVINGEEYRRLSEANRLRIVNVPAPRGIIYDRNGMPLVRNSAYYYASIMPDEFDRSKTGELSSLLGLERGEVDEKLGSASASPFIPIRLKQGLGFREIAYIEARKSDFPGLILEVEVNRDYIYGDVASHLLGYLGKPTPTQLEEPSYRGVPRDMFIGQWGIERLYDASLRGVPGKRIIELNALGHEIRLLREVPPVKGEDLTISIDINLQKEAEAAFGDRAGALVAIKPDSGEVLGLISKPSFDPNLFTKGISGTLWSSIMNHPQKPMLNRALQSQYPPGSTFKIVTALAGLEEGVIGTGTRVNCRGGISSGRWSFGCWQRKGHGTVSLHKAIVESCDVFFYETGRQLGIDRIHAYARKFGFGQPTGIALGSERSGLIPNTAWKKDKKKQPWYLGETFISAIGQGYVSVTPIQLANATAALTNGGTLYRPSLLKGDKPVITGTPKISPATLDILKKGMFGVVNEPSGTGWAAKSATTSICGKTGTAQVISLSRGQATGKHGDHAWFMAFAPLEKPEIALAVLVEHGGHGGAAAAPIAQKAIQEYMKSLGTDPADPAGDEAPPAAGG